MNINPNEVLNSTNYNLIYSLLHNVYVYKSDELLGRALEICKTNFPHADYNNLLNTILINDIDNGLKVMDQKEIKYDRNLILKYAQAFSAKKCEDYLSKNLI